MFFNKPKCWWCLPTIIYLFAFTIPSIRSQCLTDNDAGLASNKAARRNLYLGEQSFTLSMLRAINSTSENVFFSPYSTFEALLLAYFGARDNTENELRNVLNLQWANNKFEVLQAFRLEESLRKRRARNSSVTFRAADKIFVSKETGLRFEFYIKKK